ncbi:hypothetical protein HR060_11605 [Catenovulum sp. SM1970]|uniref:hypothetical protein n=1 Tax=Marinifaba aquimaris TaxID=2741323 RepID=UPI001574EAD0|nr:hypothetical protein [Marinifaba aquimaris]NTS77508.1 hypothetical protein [Marinifaba aquimaris]
MIVLSFKCFFVWLFFLIADKDKNVDGFGSIVLVIVPAILIFLFAMGLAFLGLPMWILLFTYLLYFFIPFAILNKTGTLEPKKSALFAGVVLVISLATEFGYQFILS